MFFPLKKTIKGLEIWSNKGILRFELKLKVLLNYSVALNTF